MKLQKLLSKEFERWPYWNEFKAKCENKNTTNEYRYFVQSDFVGLTIDYLLLNQDAKSKTFIQLEDLI